MEYVRRYISDVLEGEVNNVSEEELDRDIKRFEKINKILDTKDAICVITSGYIDLEDFELVKDLKFAGLYTRDKVQFVYESLNGNIYLYVNEEDVDTLLAIFDILYNR